MADQGAGVPVAGQARQRQRRHRLTQLIRRQHLAAGPVARQQAGGGRRGRKRVLSAVADLPEFTLQWHQQGRQTTEQAQAGTDLEQQQRGLETDPRTELVGPQRQFIQCTLLADTIPQLHRQAGTQGQCRRQTRPRDESRRPVPPHCSD